ncbi:MAG: hypothetical protein GX677_04100 [Treponema sp.]|nr:hypothetical protein [Treponema sp.]
MEKVSVNLENCYGIEKLSYEFNFADDNVYAIYARNGLMKTSLSKTFKMIQENKQDEIKDEIFDLSGTVNVKIDGTDITAKDVFVIKSFENAYESDSITSLLVNDATKKSISSVLKLKASFLKLLEQSSGIKITKVSGGKKVFELEPLIVKDFGFDEDSFLLNIDEFDVSEIEVDFRNVQYSSIFEEQVLKKIRSSEFQNKIDEFIIKSDEIYADFGFLDKGKFTLPKLKEAEKSLSKHSFFVKDNKIVLAGGFEIGDCDGLKEKIKEVDEKLKGVPELKEIEKMLSDVKGMAFKEVIEKNPEIVAYLKTDELDKLKKILWLSYIWDEEAKFQELRNKCHDLETEISTVNVDDTPWRDALNIFEDRFDVPYNMKITNLKSSIIGESIPRVEFSFTRDSNSVCLSRTDLESKDVLSQGEKRALYLLNIVFDIEECKRQKKETLFIIDDIADSFDYKNKYAIIEYLYDMAKENDFCLIIMSHNFDFYRTVSSRLCLKRENRLSAESCINEISLKQEKYQDRPFEFWKKNLVIKNILALIPFVRNLIEYGEDKKVGELTGIESDYLILTNLLHEKDDTERITFEHLKKIYKSYMGVDNFNPSIDNTESVCHEIYIVADSITNSDVDLENKIILAIAIRHLAEKYMIQEINNYSGELSWKTKRKQNNGSAQEFMNHVKTALNQTRELCTGFQQFGDKEKVKIVEQVNIMTPENIHLNSFMYEPILDMDIVELIKLYQEVKNI